MRKASKQLNIRLTEEDFKIITHKAELSEMNVSEYIRACACNKQVKGFKKSDVLKPNDVLPGQRSIEEYL